MTNTLDYNNLIALKAIFDQGSFTKGAAALNVTQSAISQRIKALESQVGCPIVRRGPKLELTETGTLLVNHINKIADLEQDLRDKIPQLGLNQTSFRIAVNTDSLSTWWFKEVESISKELGIQFDIMIADQDIALTKMLNGEVLACLCDNEHSLSGAKAVKVHTMNYRMYASNKFYARFFSNRSMLEAIKIAPAILYGRDDHLHEQFIHSAGYAGTYPFHNVPDSGGLIQAIISGMGYGMLADEQIATLPSNVDLVNIDNDFCLAVDLYWHYWRNSSDVLIKFSQSLKWPISK